MTQHDPVSGPISPDELKRIAELPFGRAGVELRKHDPAWGLGSADNPNIKWEVTLTAMMPVSTIVEVEAPDEATAKKEALKSRLDWESDSFSGPEDIEIHSIAASGRKRR